MSHRCAYAGCVDPHCIVCTEMCHDHDSAFILEGEGSLGRGHIHDKCRAVGQAFETFSQAVVALGLKDRENLFDLIRVAFCVHCGVTKKGTCCPCTDDS